MRRKAEEKIEKRGRGETICEDMANPNSPDPYGPCNPDDDDLVTKYKPLLQKLSISSIVGYCSGVTAKRVGKSLAFIAGLGFVALQALAHKGFVTVDWKKVQKSTIEKLDTVRVGELG